MFRRLLPLLALFACAVPAAAQERVLNVYNWSDYIDPLRGGTLHARDRHPRALRRV
jgi:spermidine/putrescine-binding protein